MTITTNQAKINQIINISIRAKITTLIEENLEEYFRDLGTDKYVLIRTYKKKIISAKKWQIGLY